MTSNNIKVTSKQLLEHVNKTTQELGGHYSEYSTKTVSYDDVTQYEVEIDGEKKWST